MQEWKKSLNRNLNLSRIHHFNIIETENDCFKELCQYFNYLFHKKEISNDPDTLIFELKKNESYKIDLCENIEHFLVSSPLFNSVKLVFVKNAVRLSETIQNKLLKTLEEPPIETIFFIINEQKNKYLPTFESRANFIKLATTKNKVVSHTNFIEYIKQSYSKLIEEDRFVSLDEFSKVIDNREKLEEFTEYILNWHTANSSNFRQVNKLLELLKSYEPNKIFHNSLHNPRIKLYNLLKLH